MKWKSSSSPLGWAKGNLNNLFKIIAVFLQGGKFSLPIDTLA